jgi:TolA-binding protein
MGRRGLGLVLAAVLTLAGCAEVNSAVDEAGEFTDKASVCAEALGLADLNPLVDPEKLRARAEDKEQRLRELAGQVADQDVKNSLLTMADSYVEVQKERFEDLSVLAGWAKRNAERIDALRTACT